MIFLSNPLINHIQIGTCRRLGNACIAALLQIGLLYVTVLHGWTVCILINFQTIHFRFLYFKDFKTKRLLGTCLKNNYCPLKVERRRFGSVHPYISLFTDCGWVVMVADLKSLLLLMSRQSWVRALLPTANFLEVVSFLQRIGT